MKYLALLFLMLTSLTTSAELFFNKGFDGDHFVYIPDVQAKNILVIAHGMYDKSESPKDVSLRFIKRWIQYADEHMLIIISPVFDDLRFGNVSQGYGGYRNLFGKKKPADEFVNNLVNSYSSRTSSGSTQIYLYGHSAGGQFANRYVVSHPDKIIKAVISAAGRYSYPNKSVKWPYGAGDLNKTIKWDNGSVKNKVVISKQLSDYAKAASKVSIVVGSLDTKAQPKRPGHNGRSRIDIAKSWASSMNKNSARHNMQGNVQVKVIVGIGHDSKKLTAHCAKVLFQ